MSLFDHITQPVLLLDVGKTKANIACMQAKADAQGIRLRPHFKTHQSARIGDWFREAGTRHITVSSVVMAEYFARHGWNDITIAFPVNVHEMTAIQRLAEKVRLGLLVESVETAGMLRRELLAPTDVWIKIDVGAHRTGIDWENEAAIRAVADVIGGSALLHFAGVLTHAGHTYRAAEVEEIRSIYRESVERMNRVRDMLQGHGMPAVQVSVGDTPGCTLTPSLGAVDEIRPGNYVFFDVHQTSIGTCKADEVAVALACPVVACHPERRQAVIYGGAIHLSKDMTTWQGASIYGRVCLPEGEGWSQPLEGCVVTGLSQEHGIVQLSETAAARLKPGDWVCILPVHSCLTVDAMGSYLTLEGEEISTYLTADSDLHDGRG